VIAKANNFLDERFFPTVAKRSKQKYVNKEEGENKQLCTTENLRINGKRTYITYDDTQKQANPTEKWIINVGQKLSWFKNTFSEMRVITLESNRIIHPEGKQPRKEKEEDPCGQNRTKYQSQYQYLHQITVNQIKASCHTLK
jgi:hypothetical protein